MKNEEIGMRNLKVSYILLGQIDYHDVRQYAEILPPKRREKIDRLRFDRDKLLSLTAGLLIRREIGDTPMILNEQGKPYAVGSDIFFSVSHSGDCVAIAVDDREVGVDVEKLPDKEYLKIARRFYHPNELSYVENADDPARAFTRVWTRKEAYLKQIGTGIATDLTAFDTTSGILAERILSRDIEGYVLSVCTVKPLSETIYISKLELKEVFKKG